MNEKRASSRRDTVIYLRVSHRASGESIGRLADLSEDGALIITDQPLETGAEIAACIHLPPRLASETETLCGVLVPRWNRPDRNPELTLNGCLFQTAEAAHELLAYLIDEYGFNNDTIDFRRRHERSKQAREEES
jgi:hypothetical protein